MKKIFVSALLVALLIFTVCGAQAAPTQVESGTWHNLTWTYYSDGLLVFSGTGPMQGHDGNNGSWSHLRSKATAVRIEEGITTIGPVAFNQFSALTTVTLPDSLTEIHDGAFFLCANLAQVLDSKGNQKLPDNVHTLGDIVFSGCSNLETLDLGKNVYSMGFSVFGNCTKLKKITLSPTLSNIGDTAFSGCSALTGITFPAWLSNIGSRAFMNCPKLTEMRFTGNAPSFNDRAFYTPEYTEMITVYYPEGNPTWTEDKLVPKEHLIWKAVPMDAPVGPAPTAPTTVPTTPPTTAPTAAPTTKPTTAPTAKPTAAPTVQPTENPSVSPSESATQATDTPTQPATGEPTIAPTQAPEGSKPTPTETQTAIREEPESDSGLLWVCGGLGAAAIGTGTAFVLKKKSKRT